MEAIAEGSIVRDTMRAFGIERLVLSVHHVSLPASDDDLGHGSPASARARDFFRFAAELGFTGIALGPAGQVSAGNPSPYDGALFARNPLALSFRGLVPDATLARWTLPPASLADHAHAERAAAALVKELHAREWPTRDPEVRAWIARTPWLGHELEVEPEPEAFALAQLVLREQHDAARHRANALGLSFIADAQVGIGPRDRRGREGLFLPGYLMGAPPSRTNPDGQAWGYAVLDPRQLGPGGAARAFLLERIDELCEHHDGVRVDHAHGWVCPWVYRAGGDVRDGARLFESPDLPDHPALAELARVRPEQLDRALPRHHDHWVRWLEPAQVDAYAQAFDLLIARADALGLARVDIMAEVLSTCPRPLAAVLERHGLGRFRVTQKAILDDADDPYRVDRAPPRAWVMAGNHDTPPLARVVERWQGTPELARRAAHLGARLRIDPQRLERDPRALADAMLAELFLGPARHVLIYWVDLFEGRELFNRPGVVSAENWRLRVPPDFERAYRGALGRAAALALGSR